MSTCATTRPVLCGMCGDLCGMLCGIKLLISKACAVCAVSPSTCMRARTRENALRPHGKKLSRARIGIPHIPHTPHNAYISTTYAMPDTAHHTAHTAHTHSDEKDVGVVSRTIACTEQNQAEFRAAMRRWPEFDALARQMHQQGLLDGLRGCQITLTGSPEYVAKGLDAVQLKKCEEGL